MLFRSDEQLQKNNRYLVGQAGKLADSFFKKNPTLNIDFRKNVIILNKTPVHSAKTNQLKFIIKNASPELKKMILESQIWMAQNTAKLHAGLLQKSTSVFLPGESHGQKSLVGYSPWGSTELETTEVTKHTHSPPYTSSHLVPPALSHVTVWGSQI